jgi:hypothetical protein
VVLLVVTLAIYAAINRLTKGARLAS